MPNNFFLKYPNHSRTKDWKPTDTDDIQCFLATHLLMGIVQKPELSNFWSTDPLLQTPFFAHILPRNRFQLIQQFLHFADNSLYCIDDPNRDKLFKVRKVIQMIVDRCKSVYIPSEHISIDEELLLWKGRLTFKQYIPNKRARFGIKLFSLCEDSGYMWNSFVYLGKEAPEIVCERDENIVKQMGKSGCSCNFVVSGSSW